MNLNRRNFLKSASVATAGAITLNSCKSTSPEQIIDYSKLDEVLAQPILKRELFPNPIIIETLELLRFKNNFLCRVRSTDGAVGISVGNNAQLESVWPIFTVRLQPFFPGKDARDLEKLLDEVYVYKSNYKLQNLAMWVPLATIEFAILDLLGRIAGKSFGELIGEIYNPKIAVYQANNFRGKSAQESIVGIKEQVEETQAKAVKYKIGGRMSNNADYPPGRTEELIPLVRKTFGDQMTIYADSNGSYTAAEAIRVGKILEEYKTDFYEEPVPFDWLEETKQVTDAVNVPVAGGEQEPSLHNFRWLIGNQALDIVQPDMFYFGGMIRSMKVALMAEAYGKQCVPHISGSGLGYLYMMHFVSAIPNAGPFHEFKGFNKSIPLECTTSALTSNGGIVDVPTGSGLGVEIDPDFIAKHEIVKG
ncbi:MAG: mandelate racemase/muconate lactonizing enzyme family protein [Prolixibacteraceae bacterium]|jgi:L-alanine-DL-glutamate epimerase-like enolase superfamily enzyme|nr:mandelate racemase/muconate lactonizing enzyme family protein [Prolixibacteraceae bacterium]MBT6007088.1 mandelate racemase/muconate lactonizing enzyme family protein [Prolixibacteraceae bacterium]MBT6763733.1 mandelate racemase/muconate lactonizing enzyme family protein [Prolixibacteraceae bacterium]MBT6999865.1 mandelate racemase/muconate lactonizing enzyme family protein [Prolixibacteraceae bacterium]MBT7396560.1 mandelate racemase/muconate lactonizing enzyme family protein [Prolixibacter